MWAGTAQSAGGGGRVAVAGDSSIERLSWRGWAWLAVVTTLAPAIGFRATAPTSMAAANTPRGSRRQRHRRRVSVFEATERRRRLEIAYARHDFCEKLAREHAYPERFVIALDQALLELPVMNADFRREADIASPTATQATPSRRLARPRRRWPLGPLRR